VLGGGLPHCCGLGGGNFTRYVLLSSISGAVLGAVLSVVVLRERVRVVEKG
jgi:hypothetical protein